MPVRAYTQVAELTEDARACLTFGVTLALRCRSAIETRFTQLGADRRPQVSLVGVDEG